MPRPGGQEERLSFASDFATLTAKFSSQEGGNLSAELSADLALQVVLNEIAEQACHVTGASGAALILECMGEWVCRASSGAGAPELGARLGRESRLTAECITTRQVQCCDDVETDVRADVDACRKLGVRSVIMLPVLQQKKLLGVLAAFSPRISAFADEDERNLKVLVSYVVNSLALAEPPNVQTAEKKTEIPVDVPDQENVAGIAARDFRDDSWTQNSSRAADIERRTGFGIDRAETGKRALRAATGILAAVVVAFAVFLIAALSLRVWGGRTQVRKNLTRPTSDPGAGLSPLAREKDRETTAAIKSTGIAPPVIAADGDSARATDPEMQAGSLTVYENGKQVFHISAAGGQQSTPQEPEENFPDDVLVRVDPEYPQQAIEQGIQGLVVLNVRAARDGRVQDVRLLGGQKMLADAAIAAVKQWQFKTQLVNGHAVETQTRVTLIFELAR